MQGRTLSSRCFITDRLDVTISVDLCDDLVMGSGHFRRQWTKACKFSAELFAEAVMVSGDFVSA